MQAMILAAGLGTRLRPHTLRRPKPLFPVLNRPLLLRLIADLRRAGCRRLVVNAFHLREQMATALADQPELELQLEETELGTGGGLRLARPRFGPEPVLVVNGDLFHNIDGRQVMEHHRRAGNDATLVLHDFPRFNNVLTGPAPERAIVAFGVESDRQTAGAGSVTEHGAGVSGHGVPPDAAAAARLTGSGADPLSGAQRLAFTGIQVIEPALLELIEPGRFYHSIDWYRELIARGYRVRALVVAGHFWADMGTPADYLQLHARLLTGSQRDLLPPDLVACGPVHLAEAPLPSGRLQAAAPADRLLQVAPGDRSPFLTGANVRLGRGVEFADWVAVGDNAVLGAGVKLRRCVVWDGVVVPAGTMAADTIFS